MTEAPARDVEAGNAGHTVFLSYSRADQKQARSIVHVLETAGFSVWWDTLLEGGERFSRTTETALESATAVIVLWSKTSAGSHWVQDEAARGRDSGRMVPVSLDGSLPPLGFGQFQAIDVSRALGKPGSEPMQKLVRAVAALHGRAPSELHPLPAQRAGWTSRRNVLLGTSALVVAGAGGWLVWKESALFGGDDSRSVAVLPFANLSGDPAQKYFSDGLTAEIRTRLSRNALLQIVGQASSESASEEAGDAKSIARRLHVAFLLGGNVQKAGDRIKVDAELTDGGRGISQWAQSYERPLTDIFAVQAEIGAAVATALSAEIGGEEERSSSAEVGGTDNVEAFDAYLRGRDLYEAGIDEQSDRQALAWFDRAIALDEGYAGAHAARSRALAVIGNLYGDDAERIRLYDEAVVAARRATELAVKFAEGFSALGFALATGQLDMRGARAPFQKSYELGPGSADILSRYATFRSNLRDHNRAKSVIERAEKLDPLNARTFRSSGDISYGSGDYRRAIDAYEKAISLNSTLSGLNSSLGFAQLMLGEEDEAFASFAKENSSVRRLPGQAIIAHRRGNQAEAQTALDALIAEYGDKSNYQYAQVYAQWGDPDRALAALQKAWDLRDGGIMLMYADPLLEPLGQTAGYTALVKRAGFT
jgi:TolB-like protein